MKNKTIPSYPLYGETELWTTPDLLHIETIEVRSKIHNWLISPHRHGQLYQFFIVTHGRGEVRINDNLYDIKAPYVLAIPPMVVHGFEWLKETKGIVISAFQSRVSELLASEVQLIKAVSQTLLIPFTGSDESFRSLLMIANLLQKAYHSKQAVRELSIDCLTSLLMIEIYRSSNQFGRLEKRMLSPEEKAFGELVSLVEEHFTKHKPVSFYAEQMSMSTSTLNRVSKRVSNMAPSELISSKLILESKRLLTYTSMTADQVAHALGFKDAAYFSRFFKKYTGSAPGGFRKGEKL